jgi:hypothetical protein
MYQNFNQSKPFEGEYEVEFKGNKARVHGNIFVVPVTSRFNKLTCLGKTTMYHYVLTVQGKKAYFMSAYEIPK